MTFTIEPGLYNPKHFGIRLENSCYRKNGKNVSFVKMGYESKLIDYELLTQKRKRMARRIRGTMKITSVNNDLIKETAKLLTGVKYRNDSGLFILEGKNVLRKPFSSDLKLNIFFL